MLHVLFSRALRLDGPVRAMASPDILLAPADDADDGLLVTRLRGEAAWYGIASEQTQWLHNQYQRCEV